MNRDGPVVMARDGLLSLTGARKLTHKSQENVEEVGERECNLCVASHSGAHSPQPTSSQLCPCCFTVMAIPHLILKSVSTGRCSIPVLATRTG